MAMFISRLASARRTLLAASVCAAMSGLSAASGSHAASGTFVSVANCDDDGSSGTLRAAIEGANDGDTIDLRNLSCSLIMLQSGPLVSSVTSLTIRGPGSDALTIDGSDAFRVLQGSDLEIEGLTIADGRTAGSGACILSNNLSLTDAVLTHCVNFSAGAALGGGAFVAGDLTMHRASIIGSGVAGASYAMGGAAFVGGAATLYDSTISANNVQAGGMAYGGAISANGGITLHASTIDGNSAQSSVESAYGGGLHSFGGDISILDGSTVSGNVSRSDHAYAFGAGVNVGTGMAPNGIAIVRRSTITGNSASSACSACIVSGGGVHAFDSIDAAYSTFSYNEVVCDDPTSQCSAAGGAMTAFGQSPSSSITVRNTTISTNNVVGAQRLAHSRRAAEYLAVPAFASSRAIRRLRSTTPARSAAASRRRLRAERLRSSFSTIVALNHNSGGAGDIGAGPFGTDLVLEGSNSLVTAAGAGVTLPADTLTEEPLLLPAHDRQRRRHGDACTRCRQPRDRQRLESRFFRFRSARFPASPRRRRERRHRRLRIRQRSFDLRRRLRSGTLNRRKKGGRNARPPFSFQASIARSELDARLRVPEPAGRSYVDAS